MKPTTAPAPAPPDFRRLPRRGRAVSLLLLIAWATLGVSCRKESSAGLPGYVEGEFVYVAAPFAGQLEKLPVTRGQQVEAGADLFSLEDTAEQAARDGAARRLEQAEATLADLEKGARPSEIETLEASLTKARAAVAYSAQQLTRQENLQSSRAGSADDLERARSEDRQNRGQTAQLEAELITAKLGSRPDQIAAAAAEVKARRAALDEAEWNYRQKRQSAPKSGLVFDTLFREGEWVGAGKPVVALLPPANVKVRVWVPQDRLAGLKNGAAAEIRMDGAAAPLRGQIAFISPQAEYAPPVIYSREVREKFAYLVELRFEETVAAGLHPGQAVDVTFLP